LYERFLDDANRFVLFTEFFDDVVKLVQVLLAIPGRNHNLSRKNAVLNGVASDGALSPHGGWTRRPTSVSPVSLDSAFRNRPLASGALG